MESTTTTMVQAEHATSEPPTKVLDRMTLSEPRRILAEHFGSFLSSGGFETLV